MARPAPQSYFPARILPSESGTLPQRQLSIVQVPVHRPPINPTRVCGYEKKERKKNPGLAIRETLAGTRILRPLHLPYLSNPSNIRPHLFSTNTCKVLVPNFHPLATSVPSVLAPQKNSRNQRIEISFSIPFTSSLAHHLPASGR